MSALLASSARPPLLASEGAHRSRRANPCSAVFRGQRRYCSSRPPRQPLWLQAADQPSDSPSLTGWQLIDRREWDQDDPAYPVQATHRAADTASRPAHVATPGDVVQDCLAALRKADVAAFAEHLAEEALRHPRTEHWVAGLRVEEGGPLAQCSGVLSPGARRVLPGHLLRRSQVLSSLPLGLSRFQQRTAVTASTGEEAVLLWELHKTGQRWLVSSVTRDRSADEPLPGAPHPRAAPEAVVAAQLRALAASDTWAASAFSAREAGSSPAERQLLQRALERSLAAPPHSALLRHVQAKLGASALPTQSRFLQEVIVYPEGTTPPPPSVSRSARSLDEADVTASVSRSRDVEGSYDGAAGQLDGSRRFLWTLQLREDHCWVVVDVAPAIVH